MNHIRIRRIALGFAAISFGCFFALLLGVSSYNQIQNNRPGSVHAVMTDLQPKQFPIWLEDTPLTVEMLASYDGAFYEDGTGREVMNVASVLIKNNGSKWINNAHIAINVSSAVYEFECMMIPPYASVLVPEQNAMPYLEQQVYQISGWAEAGAEIINPSIEIQQIGLSDLRIRNLSTGYIMKLKIYYKTYLQDVDIYVGGVAFSTQVERLAPLDSVTISPDCYATGYSKILYVE